MKHTILESGWILEGDAGRGKPIRLLVADTLLKRSYPGVAVGRHPALCELVIDEASISHRHFRLSLDGGQLMVEDLNSLNGCQVDRMDLPPFQPVPLEAGQQLTVGRITLEVSRVES